jgi:hypothetical protein
VCTDLGETTVVPGLVPGGGLVWYESYQLVPALVPQVCSTCISGFKPTIGHVVCLRSGGVRQKSLFRHDGVGGGVLKSDGTEVSGQ